MKKTKWRYVGISFLGILWLWLASFVVIKAGVTLVNIFWIAASGIIVFVPLYKRYLKKD